MKAEDDIGVSQPECVLLGDGGTRKSQAILGEMAVVQIGGGCEQVGVSVEGENRDG